VAADVLLPYWGANTAPQIPAGFGATSRRGNERGKGVRERKRKERKGTEENTTNPGNKFLVTALAASLSHRQSLAMKTVLRLSIIFAKPALSRVR